MIKLEMQIGRMHGDHKLPFQLRTWNSTFYPQTESEFCTVVSKKAAITEN
jgi:hypothetical protein